MRIRTPRQLSRTLLVAATATLVLGAAACGDDDDDAEPAATTAAVTETTHAADHTTTPASTVAAGEGSADAAAFCEAEIAAEAAAFSGDMAAAGPAFEALVAAAPADIKPAVEAVVANAETGPGSPEFDEPYGEMIGFMQENCGYAELNVTASEYAFGGLPEELAAGPTIVTLENIGDEFHEILFVRVNDDVTESAEELLALSQEEVSSKIEMKGVAFAPNGTTANTVVHFDAGRYIAVCFLPQGATAEVMAQMEGPDSSLPEGAGPPHFTAGMVHEFTVA